jgi:hypothetical protein
MTEYCGLPDESQWVPVTGDPSQLPPSPPPVVAEPVPGDAVVVDPETWDPCAPWVFPEGQEPVYEVTLNPGLILPPFVEQVSLVGVAEVGGRMREVNPIVQRMMGVVLHQGLASAEDSTPPAGEQPIPAVYTQRSVRAGNTAATAGGMTDGQTQGGTETVTGEHNLDADRSWVQMDLGSPQFIGGVVVGADTYYEFGGGVVPENTENADILGRNNTSDDWVVIGNTGTPWSDMWDAAVDPEDYDGDGYPLGFHDLITVPTPGAFYRYIRIRSTATPSPFIYGGLAVTELYAVPASVIPLAGVTSHSGALTDQLVGSVEHLGASADDYYDAAVSALPEFADMAVMQDGSVVVVPLTSSPLLEAHKFDPIRGFLSVYATPLSVSGATGPANSRGPAFSPDGTVLFAPSGNSPRIMAWAWDRAIGFGSQYSNPSTLPGASAIRASCTVSPSGDAIVSTNAPLNSWPWSDVAGFGNRHPLPSPATGGGLYLAFSPSGSAILALYDGASDVIAYQWDDVAGAGAVIGGPPSPGIGFPRSVSFVPSGAAVMLVGDSARGAYEWDDATGIGAKYADPAGNPLYSIARFSPSGNMVAVSDGVIIRVFGWDDATGFGAEIKQWNLGSNILRQLAFGPDGYVFAAVSTAPLLRAYRAI